MTLVWKSGLNLQSPASNDPLLDLNTQPSLDLQFATGKTLDDRVSGFPLVNHQRDASSGKSAGTYVGSDGLIKTSVVNLAEYSEDLSQWGGSGNVNSNSYIAPNGTLTADELTSLTRFMIPVVPGGGGTYRVSFWLKASGNPGTLNVTLSGAYGLNRGTYTFTATSEWVRVEQEVLLDTAATNFGLTFVYVSTPVLIWGLQAEIGSTATTYIPTTTTASGAPRFDHDPVTGESLGLLIEESRTNTLQYSEAFDNAWWSKSNSVITANAVTSPAGDITADRITPNAVTNSFAAYKLLNFTSGDTYTQSIFAKANTYSVIGLEEQTNSGGVKITSFDLSNGTVGVANAAHTVSIEDFGNGWYRCSITYSCTETANDFIAVRVLETINTGSANWTADGASNLYLWGAQLEANASFPTSYIPTSGSTVTRAADVADITGTNFSSWYNQSEGTVFVREDSYAYNNTSALPTFAHFTDGTLNNYIRLNGGSAYVVRNFTNTGGVTQTQTNIGLAPTDNTRYSIALGIAANNARLYADGNSTATVNPYLLPVVNKLEIGAWVSQSNTYLNGHIARLTYYPYRLPDATLQEITS